MLSRSAWKSQQTSATSVTKWPLKPTATTLYSDHCFQPSEIFPQCGWGSQKGFAVCLGALPARWHRLAETFRTGWEPASCKEHKSCHLMSWSWLPERLCCAAKARIAVLGFMTPLSRNKSIKSLDHLFKGHHLGLN